MNHYPHVRASHTCVACDGPKDVDLLLCWPCHHKEKRANDGCYSREIEGRLAELEEAFHAQV